MADRSEQLLAKLLEHQEITGRNLSAFTVTVQGLAEGQKHTDERWNALIAVVDELVRKRRDTWPRCASSIDRQLDRRSRPTAELLCG
jgi:hypothetical protein